MKKTLIVAVFAVLVTSQLTAYLMLDKKKYDDIERKGIKHFSSLEKGIDLLTPERMIDLRVDEYFLLKKIEEKNKLSNISLESLKKQFEQDPFKRLAYKDDFISEINIERKDVIDAIGKKFDGNFYSVKSAGGSFGLWNDILIKALYCDISGYDDQDFFILNLMHKQDGGYFDTHFLLALLLLKENGCEEEERINEQIDAVSNSIINALESDREFSDLYAERIVFLYWAGYGNSIKKEWVELINKNFIEGQGWIDKQKEAFSVHVTGLSLLSLLYYAEGENKQPFY